MAVTKTIIKLSNTEAVIRISGIAGDTATIILDSDLLLPLEYLNNDPIQVNIGEVYCTGVSGGYASIIRNNVTIMNVANSSLEPAHLLGEPFVPDSINNTSNIVVTISGQQSQVYIYLKKVSGFTSTDSVIDSAFNVLSLFGAGEQGAWYDPSDFQPNWRRNLLTWSEDFSNGVWSKVIVPCTVTGGQLAPNNSTTATLITASSGYGGVFQANSKSNISSSFSTMAYFKQGNVNTGRLTLASATTINGVGCDFSLTGIGSASTPVAFGSGWTSGTSTINSIGDGWYLCTLTAISSTSTDVNIVIGHTATSGAGSTLTVWHPQLELGSSASTYQKITDGIQDYYNVQPQPVLFQDSAGTIPVTAVEQPVGLMLDKSRGLALGAELVANGDFSNGSTGWTAQTDWAITTGSASYTKGGAVYYIQTDADIPIVSGNWYKLTINILNIAGASAIFGLFNKTSSVNYFGGYKDVASTGVKSFYFLASSTTTGVRFYGNNTGSSFTVTNISVKQIAGNHAFQATTVNKPLLSARVNSLIKTEDFSDAVWAKLASGTGSIPILTANYGTAPNGTLTAWRMQLNLGATPSSAVSRLYQSGGATATANTNSIYMKTVDGSTKTVYMVSSNIPTLVTITSEWSLISSPPTVNSAYAQIQVGLDGSLGTSSTADILIWHPDVRPTNSGALLPPYQRVNTASDYDTIGFPLYLACNGSVSSRSMSTNSIDFTGTDKMTVVTGVRKLSDATNGWLIELSTAAGGFTGTFCVTAPRDAASNYGYISAGSSGYIDLRTPANYVSPISNIVTAQSSISNPTTSIRTNGSQVALSLTASGSGNFGNYPLYLFARAGNQYFFNGQFYGAIIRGETTDQTSVIKAEKLMATKTGITF